MQHSVHTASFRSDYQCVILDFMFLETVSPADAGGERQTLAHWCPLGRTRVGGSEPARPSPPVPAPLASFSPTFYFDGLIGAKRFCYRGDAKLLY